MKNPQIQLGLDLRTDGMERVLTKNACWADLAARAFRASFPPGAEITGEDIRRRVTAFGVEAPQSCKAWGALTHKLARAGRLADTGRAVKATDPKSHACRLVVWRVQ